MNNNRIRQYNDMIYETRPVKYSEYVSNKYNDIHAQLYNDALNKFLKELKNKEEFLGWTDDQIENDIKIIEIKNTEYWKPSSVIIMKKVYPFSKHKYSLSDYWNNYQQKEYKNIDDLKILNEKLLAPEILSLDYIRGKAKIECRQQGVEFEVDFDYINDNTLVSEEYSLNNTFSYKYNYQ